MREYIGKICPYCKTPFKETDNIVVCSMCDMPHHKDCWVENQGCTTFGCMGTIKAVASREVPPAYSANKAGNDFDIEIAPGRKVYCTKCGAQNDEENNFCEKCGQSLAAQKTGSPQHTHYTHSGTTSPVTPYMPQTTPIYPAYNNQPQYQPPNAYQNNPYQGNPYQANQYQSQPNQSGTHWGNNSSEESSFIGNNSTYYATKFAEMRSKNKTTSWNWSAFLFGVHWFAYRKMYAYAAAYYGIAILVALMGEIGGILSIAITICCGIFANYLYMKKVEQRLQEARNMMEPMRTQHINKTGGTSVLAIILFDVGLFVLGILPLSI